MKFYKLETVLAQAEECWANDERNKDGSNEPYKRAFLLGWISQSYKNAYAALPDYMKEDNETLTKKIKPCSTQTSQ